MAKKKEMTPEQQERSRKAKEAWARRRAAEAEAKGETPEAAPAPASEAPKTVQEAIPEAFEPITTPFGEDALKEEKKLIPKVPADAKDVRTVHFVVDGFTALGKVWYYGETLAVAVPSSDWDATCDRNGNSWMDILDLTDQIEKWGEVKFRPGEFKKAESVDTSEEAYLEAVRGGDPEAVRRIEKARARAVKVTIPAGG